MLRLIFNSLFKIRDGIQALGRVLFNKLRDSDGKLKYLSPTGWKRLAYTFGISFFIIVVIMQLISRDPFGYSSLDDYEKEITSDGGLRPRAIVVGETLFDGDPLSFSGSSSFQDPIFGGTERSMFGDSTQGTVSGTAVPEASECYEIIERAKAGESLSISQRAKLEACIDNEVVPLVGAERGLLKALASSDLSPQERAAIIATLSGAASPLEQNVSDIASTSVNPQERLTFKQALDQELKDIPVTVALDELRRLSRALADRPEELARSLEGIAKISKGFGATPEERREIVDLIRELRGGESAILDNPRLASDKEAAIQALLQDVESRADRISQLEDELRSAQIDAQSAIEKLGQGLMITDEEQAKIDRLADARRALTQEKQTQEDRQRSLIELTSQLQNTIARASMAMRKTIPSGVFEAYADYEPLKCEDLEPLPIKIAKPKQPTRKATKVAATGSKQGLNLGAKNAYNIYKLEEEAKKDGVEYVGKRLDPSSFLQNDQKINIGELFIMNDEGKGGVTISPETKIIAMLDSEIMVSANGSPQQVRIKILQDVYDAKNQKLIIPKNSVAIGRTSGFDEQTGIMDFNFNRVSVGSGNTLEVSLSLGSGDGTMGLKGQVRDTRGRYLLGAFITSFSSGALDFITQDTITAYQQSQQAITAISGAAMSGGADVMSKIANMYASDLQNTAPVYFAPRGLPVILFAQ